MNPSVPLARQGRRGFALLITIVMMALLVLIMVSFASLTRVEIQVAKTYQNLAQARQNALMAMNIALGKLQQYAGPDTSVTARADITSIVAPTQPYLTGVWLSGNSTSTPSAWLVSGNEGKTTMNDSSAITPTQNVLDPNLGTFPVLDNPDSGGQVYLLGTGSVSTLAQGVLLAKQTIKAPSGSIPGVAGAPTTGHYAWWVGDEGIKASASLVDQNLTAKPLSYNNSGSLPGDDWSSATDLATVRKRNQLNQLMQPRPALEKILTTVPPKPDTSKNDDPKGDLEGIPKLLTINQLPLLPSASGSTASALTQKKAVFHDLTALSLGVLADTSTGKLRTDYTPADTGVPALNAYIKLRPDVPATAAAPYKSVFYPKAPSWNGTGTPTWPIFGVSPVMTEAAIYFAFDVSGGQLNVKYWLMVELWNPYTATLEINPAHALKYSVTLPSDITFLVKQYDQVAYNTAMTSLPATTPVVKASQLVTLTNPGGIVLSGTTGANSITIDPGRTLTLRGASTLDLSSNSVLMGTYRSVSTSLAALNSSPAVYTKVDLQTAVGAGMVYKLQLASDGSLLQSCTVKSAYTATTDTAISNSAGTGLPCLAFGYFIGSYFGYFVKGQDDYYFDLRLPVHACPSPLTPYSSITSTSISWSTKPATNALFNNGADFYANGSFTKSFWNRISPFDLPRQELISVAELRHLIGPTANDLGAVWGAAATNQLFDRAFFSTVPHNYAWSVDGTEPRPNRYLEVYKPFGVSAATLADLRDKTNSARYQLIRGAFNINSTSIAAWKAILGSPRQTWDFATASPATSATTTTKLNNVFFRTPAGAKEINWAFGSFNLPAVPTSAELVGSSNWSRSTAVGRQLSDNEITSLATRIVTLLKTRGRPFVSLSELIGGTYILSGAGQGGPPKLKAQGFWEYAINSAPSDINGGNGLNGDYMTPGAGSYTSECVTQGDILAKVAPFIAARSDTFIIRTYGDVQNPVTAKIEGRVWCEATVQRVPDLVSDATAPVATVVAPPAASNPFGRRFKIISFRWLSPNDL